MHNGKYNKVRNIDGQGISFWFSFIGFFVEMTIECIDSTLNSRYLLSLLIRNIQAHIFLHGNDKLHRVQRIETKLLEGGRFG